MRFLFSVTLQLKQAIQIVSLSSQSEMYFFMPIVRAKEGTCNLDNSEVGYENITKCI